MSASRARSPRPGLSRAPLSGVGLAAGLLLLAFTLAPETVLAKGSLSKLEDEFERVIQKATPTTVVCLPYGVDPKQVPAGTSGVIVSRKGLVLSDGDVGIYFDTPSGKVRKKEDLRRSDVIEVRMPDPKGKGFRSYRARVIKRDRDMDSTLLRMEKPPSGLKYLRIGDSDELKVGDFSFTLGNSFGLAAEAPPTLTAGVIASLVPAKEEGIGKYAAIYTSAAVNPGVNGGPLVDVHGQLIGTISSAVSISSQKDRADPALAYAYLGKVVPTARLKAHYRDVEEYDELFPEKKRTRASSKEASALALVLHHTARRAGRSLVSLEIKRKGQLSLAEPGGKKGTVNVPRYVGAVSGVLISPDGYILTSLYNLANISTLVRGWKAPANAKVKAGLEGITGIQVHLSDGRSVSGTFIAHHEGIGLAVLKAEMGAGTEVDQAITTQPALRPAPDGAFQAGRFVLALGNPFGAKRLEDPLLTIGILSKQHAEDGPHPWRGQWQTDAGVTDGNCGGAAVDLEGRLLGVMTIWSSTQHGRYSGIGFIIPWTQIEPVLGEMKRGRSFRPPFFGLTWAKIGGDYTTVIATIVKGSAAMKAGLKPNDTILDINDVPVDTPDGVKKALKGLWSGDEILLTIRRDGVKQDLKVVLGARE